MNIILETARLRLREFNLNDAAFIIELLNSPGWLANIGDRNVHNEEQAMAYLQNGAMKSYAENGFGLSLVELKEGNVPIGMCGLIRRDFLDHPDIGFALLPGYDGKGYAFEIAKATFDHGREKLGLAAICAIVLPENTRSVKLLEKLGMKMEKTIVYPGTNEELSLYVSPFTLDVV